MTPALIAAFDEQAAWCDRLGAPFNAGLLRFLADELRRGGPLARLLPDWPRDPMHDAVPLRTAGALHALVLSGNDDALASGYPPNCAAFDAARLGPIVDAAVQREREHFERWLASPPQTNEVLRSAVLLGGFALIALRAALPLALFEIGASAGLNLCWDRFHYTFGDRSFGPATSPVRLAAEWRGEAPALPNRIEVIDRAGCDQAPIDVRDPEQALRLAAYIWPDQTERSARLRAAIALALERHVEVEAADAGEWLERRLSLRPGTASVVYHSIVWQYLPAATRARVRAHLEALGAQASEDAPLAWLRLEPTSNEGRHELMLTTWPPATKETLARAHPHGAWAEWLAPASVSPTPSPRGEGQGY